MKGFTLIELLVVIAIIGVLSSVVLASLNTARTKGADTAVKSNLAGARAQAEIFYDANLNLYLGVADVCAVGASAVGSIKGINPSVLAAASAAGAPAPSLNAVGVGASSGVVGTAVCNSTATAWAAQSPLKAGGSYCVDSTGAAISTATTLLTATGDTAC